MTNNDTQKEKGLKIEVAHNKFVVKQLAARGVIFVEKLSEVPDGAVTARSMVAPHRRRLIVERSRLRRARHRGLDDRDKRQCPVPLRPSPDDGSGAQEERDAPVSAYQ